MEPLTASLKQLRAAACDSNPVLGLTHNFYRYPARFSPRFAAAAIREFSDPGDLVLDPFMGGGTTVVESLVAGRRVVGADINSLAVFIARAKTTPMRASELHSVSESIRLISALINYRYPRERLLSVADETRARNLSVPAVRAIKKAIAVCLTNLENVPTVRCRSLLRCVVLRVAQWALDGRSEPPSLHEFRRRLVVYGDEMVVGLKEFIQAIPQSRLAVGDRTIVEADARLIHESQPFSRCGLNADLVVTSPPYPGVHVLYRRWQVNGRRESPAPYWIADCSDGHFASFYTFGDREQKGLGYFDASLDALRSIRRAMKPGAYFIQLVVFGNRDTHLPLYLRNMERAGFKEAVTPARRIWRDVPNRRWPASLKGRTSSCREVVLIHRSG